ncbi:MAG TPA: exosortase [Tepidisphaeraceae bacterium]|nr:exosortase [Tepidisphaeraceae bacterium]
MSQSVSPSTQIVPPLQPGAADGAAVRPGYLGLPSGAWGQIGIIAFLMIALFRFNLARLWGKTNPFDGQDANWQHSIFVPLIGLWYLYIHREELIAAAGQPVRSERGIRTLATFGLGGLCAVAAYLTGGGMTWVAAAGVLTLVAVFPARVGTAVFGTYSKAPEVIRWAGRIGLTLAIAALITVGPKLGLPPGQWAVLQATVLLVGVLAVAMWLPVLRPTSTVLGSVVMFAGLLIFAGAIYPIQNDYLKDLGMVITLFGVTTLLGGWAVMRVAWFPIAFLVVALPWPELVYQQFAWPLQKLAASAAVGTLRMFGIEARRDITMIWFQAPNKEGVWEWVPLSVAEACAGLRSLMTFLMVAGTVAFLQRRPMWEKLAITASAVPIAIFCNMMRVSGQGLLHRYVSEEISQGFAHSFVGLLMLIPGFFLILLVQWFLDKALVEEVDGRRGGAGSKRKIVEVARKKAPAPEASEAQAPSGGGIAGAVATAMSGPTPAVAGGSVPRQVTQANTAAAPAAKPAAARVTTPVAPKAAAAPTQVAPIKTPAPVARATPAAPAQAVPSAAKAVTPAAPVAARPAPRATPAGGLLHSPVKRPVADGGQQVGSTLKPSGARPAGAQAATPVAGPAGGTSNKGQAAQAGGLKASATTPGSKPAAPPTGLKPAGGPVKPVSPVASPATPVAGKPAAPGTPKPVAAARPVTNPATSGPAGNTGAGTGGA